MSSADYDVAYCDACERCHLIGICPLTDKAQKVVSMTDAGWAEKLAARKWRTPELQRIYASALKAEYARAMRAVKDEIKRVKLSGYQYDAHNQNYMLVSLGNVLTALQRGRGGKG